MQRQTLRLFWRTARRHPRLLAGAWVAAATSELAAGFIGPAIIAALFNRLQHGVNGEAISLANSWPLLVAFAVVALYADVIGWRLVGWCLWHLETYGMRHLYTNTMAHLLRLSLNFHNDQFGGALVSQVNKLASAFEKFWDTVVFMITRVVVALVAAVAILAFVWWPFAVVLALLCVSYLGALAWTTRPLLQRFADEAQASNRITGRFADVITNVSAVKGYAREYHEQQQFDAVVKTWQVKVFAVMRRYLPLMGMYSSIMYLIKCAAVVGAVIALQTGAVSAGAVYLMVSYTLTVCQHLWETNRIVRDLNKAFGDAREMTGILAIQPQICEVAQPVVLPTSVGRRGCSVQFDQVGFTHSGAGEVLLRDFDLVIPAGQRVGLVGVSGSGKTTLTRLLLRFIEADTGAIRLDGVPIAKVRQRELREAIAYVPQEPVLFHRTLRENIAYGCPDADEATVRLAAGQANALEFIDALPDGLNTLVGERGVKLSGGQRQRIALARAMLKDAPLLVLDEATSALDSHSEHLIQQALQVAMQGRTAVVIAHRLSTIAALDRILVLESGRIMQDGTHEQLLHTEGPYADMWHRQSGGFLVGA